MSKVIRLTESDLVRLVEKVLNEQEGGNPLVFSQVVEVPNTPKDLLYDKIKQWLVSSYNDWNKVSQMDDKSSGIIMGKGSRKYSINGSDSHCSSGFIDYKFKIQIKDNKFKIEISDFNHQVLRPQYKICEVGFITDRENHSESGSGKGARNAIWVSVKGDVKKFFDGFVGSLEKTVKANKLDDFQP
jgi:hypothetical protein